MAFDITSVLKGVSGPDTGKEQIEYIPVDQIDPDPNNFYSLDGLDELAGNIELIGLQQPLRVRPGEDGRFIVVSGHRRRAAILMIRDGGNEMFRDGVPCIVDRGDESPAMRELRLIYANASTRVMGPAEISKQAERTEALLYQLKEEGIIEFPGRMRDHVAEACRISKTKLARLHAIRNNLVPELLEWFDNGGLNESEAYELQKLPKTGQEEIAASIKRSGSPDFISIDGAAHCAKYAEKFMAPHSCPNGGECDHHEKRFVQALRTNYTFERCNGGCCLKCGSYAMSCPHACAQMKAKQKATAEEKKAEREAESQRAEERKAERDRQIRESRQAQAQRVLPLIRAQGLRKDEELPGGYYHDTPVSLYEKQAAGDFDGGTWYDDNLIPTTKDKLIQMASRLDCSVDYLLGLTEDPAPASERKTCPDPDTGAAGWSTGDPPAEGRYLCTVDLGPKVTEQRCEWKGGQWMAWGEPVKEMFQVMAWFRLPDGPYYPREHWDEVAEEEEEDNDD